MVYTVFVMVVVAEIANLSLALVAFAWLMWVTLPWAFGERLDYEALSKKIDPEDLTLPLGRLITRRDVKKANEWLNWAQDSFLAAGGIFLISGLLDLAAPSFTGPTPPIHLDFTNLPYQYLTVSVFLGGLGVLGVSVFRTQQVIKFIGSPSQIDSISTIGTFYAVSAIKSVGAMVTVLIGLIDFGIFSKLISAWLTPLSPLGIGLRVLDFLFFIGGLGAIPTFFVDPWVRRRRNALGPFLILLPWPVFLVFVLIGGL